MDVSGLDEKRFDEALDALAHVQRRKILVALMDHNPQNDAPSLNLDSAEATDAVERLIEMEHVHLPKLVEYGFVEWNREENEVTKGQKFDEIRPLLELLVEHEDELPIDWL